MNSDKLAKILNLREGEEIVEMVRKYPLSFFWQFFLAVIIIVLPFFFLFMLFSQGVWGIVAFAVILSAGIIYALRIFISWYNNVSLITNYRVVDVYQNGFFDKTVSGVSYDKIQDISFRKKGIFETLFNCGTVQIQLANTNTKIQLRKIKHPQKIQELTLSLQEEYKPPIEEVETRNTEKVQNIWDKMKNMSSEELKAIKEKIDSKFEDRDKAFSDFLEGEEE